MQPPNRPERNRQTDWKCSQKTDSISVRTHAQLLPEIAHKHIATLNVDSVQWYALAGVHNQYPTLILALEITEICRQSACLEMCNPLPFPASHHHAPWHLCIHDKIQTLHCKFCTVHCGWMHRLAALDCGASSFAAIVATIDILASNNYSGNWCGEHIRSFPRAWLWQGYGHTPLDWLWWYFRIVKPSHKSGQCKDCVCFGCLSCPSSSIRAFSATCKKSWICVAISGRRGFPEVNPHHRYAGFLPYKEEITDL
jgi:hypothetical protein